MILENTEAVLRGDPSIQPQFCQYIRCRKQNFQTLQRVGDTAKFGNHSNNIQVMT
jgi:hypothetical protein